MKSNTLNVLFLGVLSAALFATGCTAETSSSVPSSASAAVAPAAANRVAIIVTLSDARPMNEVVVDLQKHGFEIDRAMEQIGCVSGHIGADSIDTLKAVAGVAAVERETVFTVD